MIRPLLVAIQFLTRLPLPKGLLHESDYQPKVLGQSVLFYPLVGFIIGIILFGFVTGLNQLSLQIPPMVVAALILFCWILLTGALHLDGLADSADAWVGGYGDRNKTLAIMKDPYCGPAGVVIIVSVLLIKFAALTYVLQSSLAVLVVSTVLARTAIPILFITTPYVRQNGIGMLHAENLPRSLAWIICFCIFGLIVYLLREQGVALLVGSVIVFVLLRYLMMQRLGGTTGDTAGAMIELLETMCLVIVSIMVSMS